MADTGWISPGTVLTNRSWSTYSNTPWNDIDNAKSSDNSYATLVTTDGVDNISYYLEANNFGFSIPDGATIDGIEFRVECKYDLGLNAWDEGKVVDESSSLSSTNDRGDVSISTDEKYIYFGDSTELWGTTWAYTDINSSNFGCALLDRIIDGDHTVSVDHIQIKVYYTTAGTGTNSDRDAKITGAPEDVYTREAITPLPGDDTDLTTSYSEQDITDVSASDDDRVGLETTSVKYLIHQFKKYNDNNALENMNVSWEGQTTLAPSSSTVYLQVYNLDTTLWETLDSDNSSSVNTDFSLSGIVNADLANYYDVNYLVSFRVYQYILQEGS